VQSGNCMDMYTGNMLYLLGGASRAGKSRVAHRLLVERHVPYLPLDALMMGLARGVPTFGMHPSASGVVRGQLLWPLVRAMCVNTLETNVPYLLEGDTLLPAYVAELRAAFPTRVCACFIGYADIAPQQKLHEIRMFSGQSNDWVSTHSDQDMVTMVEEMIGFSQYLRDECARYHLVYVDCSSDFLGTNERAFRYLTTCNQPEQTRQLP